VTTLFGLNWVWIIQVQTVITLTVLAVAVVVAWRRHRGHPILLMTFVMTLLVWQDPPTNWAPWLVYNPSLWHWPEDWPLVSLSPTVEPFMPLGYVVFYLLPFFPAMWVLRRVQARRPLDSFVWRHPLISLGALIFAVGAIWDTLLEVALIRTGIYFYSQVVPFGSIFVDSAYQFPMLWECTLITLVMIPGGVLAYRDDTGRSVAEKLAQRARILPSRPVLGTFVAMFVIVNVGYFAYTAGWLAIKATKTATAVACPWPYPEAKVYDPNGFYEEEGAPGPYSVGIWSTWMQFQPDGRPEVSQPPGGGRCGSDSR